MEISVAQKSEYLTIKTFCAQIVQEFYGYEHGDEWLYDLENDYIYSSKNRGCMLVMKEFGEIIGCIGLRPLESLPEIEERFSEFFHSPREVAVLTKAYIVKTKRNMGLGKILVKEIEFVASRIGYSVVYLHCSSQPDIASFWIKMGYEVFKKEADRFQTVHLKKNIYIH